VQPRVEAAGDSALATSLLQWTREWSKKLDALSYRVLEFNTPFKNYLHAKAVDYKGLFGRVGEGGRERRGGLSASKG